MSTNKTGTMTTKRLTTSQTAQPELAAPPKVFLVGNIVECAHPAFDADALVRPLGLSGTYTITGIDHWAAEKSLPPHPSGSASSTREAAMMAAEWDEWRVLLRAVQAFDVTLTPDMTVIHIMRLAALEHRRRIAPVGGERIPPTGFYFETMTITGTTIEIGMLTREPLF